MLSAETLLLFLPTIILLVIMPGPDFAIVSKISLFDGARPAQAAAIGISLGICVHTVLAMLGISAILASSAILFSILKYAGAFYLFYLGIKTFMESGKGRKLAVSSENYSNMATGRSGINGLEAFRAGFLTNVLNPKAVLAFMVLYPQFLESDKAVFIQFLEMGLISAAACLSWFLSLAWFLGKIRNVFTKKSFQRWLLRATGSIFMAFGMRIALQEME